MGQKEVLDVLVDKGWRTKTQIAEELKDFQISGINESLKRLVKGKFIEVKKCPELKHGFLYKMIKFEDNEDD